jgi:hypothetical protein
MIIYLYFDCLSPHMFCLHASFEVTQRYPTIVAEANFNRPRFRPFKGKAWRTIAKVSLFLTVY